MPKMSQCDLRTWRSIKLQVVGEEMQELKWEEMTSKKWSRA